uniref:Androglobin domain-containing protein n=1 Tax=Pygocentrus nattereri TaxID=42514 RepID=A0A3B4BWE2_PYGNA
MRLIGCREPLPQLAREAPATNFSVKEFKDYYVPNEKNIICRHTVKVSGDHVATVQFQTSKADVHIKLSILDHEKEVASKQGRGHVIIPVYCFSASKDSSGSADECAGAQRSQDGPDGGQREGGAEGKAVGNEDCPPPASERFPAELVSINADKLLFITVTDTVPCMCLSVSEKECGIWVLFLCDNTYMVVFYSPVSLYVSVCGFVVLSQGHKYIVQAEVLHKSWPLDDSLSDFIQTLRYMEQNEMRVGGEKPEDLTTPANSEAQKLAMPKTTRKSKEKDKDKSTFKPGSRMEQVSVSVFCLLVFLGVLCKCYRAASYCFLMTHSHEQNETFLHHVNFFFVSTYGVAQRSVIHLIDSSLQKELCWAALNRI